MMRQSRNWSCTSLWATSKAGRRLLNMGQALLLAGCLVSGCQVGLFQCLRHLLERDQVQTTVQDLADQSNLLAVNASIEAARAGDRGKGFAVVATEIKTLADQSKEATGQIGTILSDTRKWVSSVVMATEQGTKAVESGVEQSKVTGQSINSLFDSVATSVQAATVISASSTEQLAVMEQASKAMVSIEQTMRENLYGTSQVEESAKKLEELGDSLDQLVKYYKVMIRP